MKTKIEHMLCSYCKKQITRLENGDIVHDVHYDITRTNKVFDFDAEMGTFEEMTGESNLKMKFTLCYECFIKALNQSVVLRNARGN